MHGLFLSKVVVKEELGTVNFFLQNLGMIWQVIEDI